MITADQAREEVRVAVNPLYEDIPKQDLGRYERFLDRVLGAAVKRGRTDVAIRPFDLDSIFETLDQRTANVLIAILEHHGFSANTRPFGHDDIALEISWKKKARIFRSAV